MEITILGGGYAGVTCAVRLARQVGGGARVTLINASDRFVERIRLHQQAAGGRPPERDLHRLVQGAGVRLRIGRASALDVDRKLVIVDGEAVRWDRLVFALGSRTDADAVPGVREHAFTLDAGSVARFAARIPAGGRGRVVVVGGGLTGLESASELAEAFPLLEVTLLTHRPIGDGWSAGAREHLVATLARLGVLLREGARVTSVGPDRVETDGGPVPFDLCLWAGGFVAHALARDAGLAVNQRGQVLVDPALRSVSHPAVYVAGDAAAPADGPPWPMGCKTAQPAGAHVADSLARLLRGDEPGAFAAPVPIYCVSLGRRDGLIQMPGPDGSPTGPVLTGGGGAWFKEIVCQSTVWELEPPAADAVEMAA